MTSVTHYISGTVEHMIMMLLLCRMISSRVFFHFFKILIFLVVRRVKGQKMAQNELISLISKCLISQEPYIIWSSFMIHMCKRIISPGVFYISKFWFLLAGKGQKFAKNGKKLCLSHSLSQESYLIWL